MEKHYPSSSFFVSTLHEAGEQTSCIFISIIPVDFISTENRYFNLTSTTTYVYTIFLDSEYIRIS